MTDKKIIIENNNSATDRINREQSEANMAQNPKDSYEGRKHDPKIDGPEQASQETDEIFADPRKQENLPAGGVNAGELDAGDLSKQGNIK